MGYYKQKTSYRVRLGLQRVCLIFKRKEWEGGFISENFVIYLFYSSLTFFSYCFFLVDSSFLIKQPLSGFLKNRCSCISDNAKFG